jgi:hypothetical protein
MHVQERGLLILYPKLKIYKIKMAAPPQKSEKIPEKPVKTTLRDSMLESKDAVNPTELAWRVWLAERLEDRDLAEGY